MADVLRGFSETPLYLAWMIFLGAFPIITAMLSIDSSRRFTLDREAEGPEILPEDEDLEEARRRFTTISVVIPARNEQALLAKTIEAVLALDWPELELIIIDDGSTDSTFEIARSFVVGPSIAGDETTGLARGRSSCEIRLIRQAESGGKAEALNRALRVARGELVMGLDADGRPDRRVLELMAPHFLCYPNVAAVTGNPRVANTSSILTRLQAIEFSSTISVLRRAQAGWGRINTVSGVCVLFRRDVAIEVGGFDPRAATEDIMFSWELQTRDWDIFYEPRAVFAMNAPAAFRDLFRQRRRWGRGLGQVLRVFGPRLLRRSSYRMWPLASEALLSIIWALLLVAAVVFWAVAAAVGVPDLGNSPLLNHWGIIVVIISILQIAWGIRIDIPQDPGVRQMLWVAPLYPLLYWLFNAAASVSGSIPGMISDLRNPVSWEPTRPDPEASVRADRLDAAGAGPIRPGRDSA